MMSGLSDWLNEVDCMNENVNTTEKDLILQNKRERDAEWLQNISRGETSGVDPVMVDIIQV